MPCFDVRVQIATSYVHFDNELPYLTAFDLPYTCKIVGEWALHVPENRNLDYYAAGRVMERKIDDENHNTGCNAAVCRRVSGVEETSPEEHLKLQSSPG